MSAKLFSHPGRLSSWFGGDVDPARRCADTTPADAPRARTLVERRLYDDIGDFLFAHGLAPSPPHFEIAHAYLSGSDPAMARRVSQIIATHGTIDADRMAALAKPHDARAEDGGPQALAGLASRLEVQLAECLHAAHRTQNSARDYGDALNVARSRLDVDPAGTLAHIAGLTRDVVTTTRLVETELVQTRRETDRLRGDLDRAREAAERDHLTGLPNRRGLDRRLDEVVALQSAAPTPPRVAVALCDIDDFKLVNDLHGHQTGDRVLTFVANFLQTELGPIACVARHGGEEFAVVMEGLTPHEATGLLDDVRERLAARSLINQDTGMPIGRITFSAGVAALNRDGPRALGEADVALYQAKHAGKNRVTMASAGRG